MNNRKPIMIVSIAIIAIFGIMAISSLSPMVSREGIGTYIPPIPQVTPTATYTTPTSPLTTTGKKTELSPSNNSTPTPTVLPTPTEEKTVFKLSTAQEKKSFKYDNRVVATIDFSIPKLTCNKELDAVKKINTYLSSEASDLIDGYTVECDQFVEDYYPSSMEKLTYKSTSVMYHNQSVISVKNTIVISHGIGNGDQNIFCYNFSSQTGNLLSLDDVVTDKPALIEKAIEACEKMSHIEFSAGYVNIISTKICNEWYIKDDAIVLVYKPYEIASGIAGTIEIPVSGDFISIS